ncbi:hypothetical protein M758_3G244300 [Ceratodon purpureus]|nr:hypothetical protein M758_3G244300 [Ceratodon purpureus]
MSDRCIEGHTLTMSAFSEAETDIRAKPHEMWLILGLGKRLEVTARDLINQKRYHSQNKYQYEI